MVNINLDHLIEPVRPIALQSGYDRIQHIRSSNRWFGYKRAEEALYKLRQLIEYPKCQRMPNLLIIGPTNNGKSTIIEKFCRAHPPEIPLIGMPSKHDIKYDELPVLALQMPSSPDVKRFYGIILYQLGIPVPLSMRLGVLESEVLRYLKLLEVKMLIIDEIHNILGGRNDQQREFLNLLRFLGNELKIPLVGVGIKDAFLAIRSDAQLENRFEPFSLPSWQAGEEFDSLLASFASVFPLCKPSHLTEPETSAKILSMTEGILGEISTLLTKAAITAINTGREQITQNILDIVDYQSPSERIKVFERELQ